MCAVLAAVLCSTAPAGDGLLVGVSEDSMKWSPERGKLAARHMYRLGVSAVRVTIRWSPGQSAPRGPTLVALRRAIRTAGGRRLVLAVYSRAHGAPQIARRRRQYCGFVGRLLSQKTTVTVFRCSRPGSPSGAAQNGQNGNSPGSSFPHAGQLATGRV